MKATSKFITIATRQVEKTDCRLLVPSGYAANGEAYVELQLRRPNQNRNTSDRFDEEYLRITMTEAEADALAVQLMEMADSARKLKTT